MLIEKQIEAENNKIIIQKIEMNQTTNHDPNSSFHMFGKYYQDNLLKLIWKYLDLDPHHKLLYIGESGESFIPVLEKTSALLQPVVWGEECGAPHTDKKLKRIEQLDNYSFDRVLLVNAVQYFQNPSETFTQVLNTLHASGKILLVHRPGPITTLPFFRKAKKKLEEQDYPYMKIFESLRKLGADVQWKIEHVPVTIKKDDWLSLLGMKIAPILQHLSDYEVATGLQELTQGCLKYSEEVVSFEDRLMFISAHKLSEEGGAYPSIQRSGCVHSTPPHSAVWDLPLKLPLTEDLIKYLHKPSKPKCLFKRMF
ncbi:hypothetical protein HHUSO_G3674 [Huso huso]|uniref:Methyltransferase type 11 domain-containing protein n=1 Tax=Huso huso TaxID=61971 RepID=A0ABR1A3F7_HUSHU|nr:uncharacterized protein LOC117435266 [Acipenser ruthenus]